MSYSLYSRFSACSLILGGISAALAHIARPEQPADPSLLFHYAEVSQPIHVLLFGGSVLVLLGLPVANLLRDRFGKLLVSAGSLFLYLGILFADTLHCILEFSVFPVLM